jgi:glutamine synthetase
VAKEDRERLDDAVDTLATRVKSLDAALERSVNEGLEKRAHLLAQDVVPAMAAVREVADRIEEVVADEFWTLPKYSEMLFLV